jgi:hypothetical protein
MQVPGRSAQHSTTRVLLRQSVEPKKKNERVAVYKRLHIVIGLGNVHALNGLEVCAQVLANTALNTRYCHKNGIID